MKPVAWIGIVLIILGIIALAYHGFSYYKQEDVIQLGAFQATVNTKHTVPISPIIGALVVVAGVVLLVVGVRAK